MICALSDLSKPYHGYGVTVNDLVVPKNCYKSILKEYPKALEVAERFFETRKASCIVFRNFEKNFGGNKI